MKLSRLAFEAVGMASSYLRKVMLLEEQAKYKDYRRAQAKGCTPEGIAEAVLVATSPSTLLFEGFEGVLQYESILDRGFHRDTFLLLQLQQLSEPSATLPPKKAAQSAGKTIEGDLKKPVAG